MVFKIEAGPKLQGTPRRECPFCHKKNVRTHGKDLVKIVPRTWSYKLNRHREPNGERCIKGRDYEVL